MRRNKGQVSGTASGWMSGWCPFFTKNTFGGKGIKGNQGQERDLGFRVYFKENL